MTKNTRSVVRQLHDHKGRYSEVQGSEAERKNQDIGIDNHGFNVMLLHVNPASIVCYMTQLLSGTTEYTNYTNLDAMTSVNFKNRTTPVWVLDFNLCNMWQENTGYGKPDKLTSQLVLAFFEIDPLLSRAD